ncbi:MAG: YbjN domain-containing protein [Phormidium sp.]
MNKETYKVGQETPFLSALGEPINILVEEINLQKDEKNQISALLFTVAVSYETYQKIIHESLFNLFPEIGISQPYNDFEDAQVQIELQLKSSLIAYLNQQMETAKGLGSLISPDDSSDPRSNCLYYTENWLAITFKQLVSLPPELAEDGELKQGYRTLWHNQELIKEKLTAPVKPFKEVVIDFVNRKQWQYEEFNEKIIKLTFTGESSQWSFLIAMNEEDHQICCYSIYPETIVEQQREQFSIFITGVNYELNIGYFEMDLDDGELRFRTSLALNQEPLTEQLLESLVTINLDTMNVHLPQFKQLQSDLN